MKASRTCGARSMDGAFVKLSTMKRKTAAARKKLSTEPSSPSPVPRSSRVPICVWSAPRLNKTQAFSNATVRWALGTPVNESNLLNVRIFMTDSGKSMAISLAFFSRFKISKDAGRKTKMINMGSATRVSFQISWRESSSIFEWWTCSQYRSWIDNRSLPEQRITRKNKKTNNRFDLLDT